MFETYVKLRLANPSPKGGPLRDHLPFLRAKIEEMNATQSHYNQKTVTIVEPMEDEETVLLRVQSEIELGVPGRAFTGLSRSLLDTAAEGFDPYFRQNLFHGRLLAFERVLEGAEEARTISDTELIIRTVLLANKPKSLLSNQEREVLGQMKALAARITLSMEG